MRLAGITAKEALVLLRDRGGLAVLFLMPTVLVLVVTLVQEGAFRAVQGSTMPILFVDLDGGWFGRDLQQGLTESGFFVVVKRLRGRPLEAETARRAVARGEYQVGIIVSEGLSEAARARADALVKQAFVERMGTVPEADESDAAPTTGRAQDRGDTAGGVQIFFDPAIGNMYHQSAMNGLNQLVQAIEMEMVIKGIERLLGAPDEPGAWEEKTSWQPGRLVAIRETYAGGSKAPATPTSVQQNVPAWSLFAMFMIVVPLSGSLIRERDHGTLVRLRSLPISYWSILAGKVAVHVVVCLCQFVLILAVGAVVMPWLGTPNLEIGTNYFGLAVAASASALAATGFGMMMGTIARTQEAASLFGSTFVVIAGVLGGIMVPVFLMPAGMRSISRFSPLNWGLNAFLDIFLRGAGLGAILPDVLRLLAFFLGTMIVAVLCFLRRE